LQEGENRKKEEGGGECARNYPNIPLRRNKKRCKKGERGRKGNLRNLFLFPVQIWGQKGVGRGLNKRGREKRKKGCGTLPRPYFLLHAPSRGEEFWRGEGGGKKVYHPKPAFLNGRKRD